MLYTKSENWIYLILNNWRNKIVYVAMDMLLKIYFILCTRANLWWVDLVRALNKMFWAHRLNTNYDRLFKSILGIEFGNIYFLLIFYIYRCYLKPHTKQYPENAPEYPKYNSRVIGNCINICKTLIARLVIQVMTDGEEANTFNV